MARQFNIEIDQGSTFVLPLELEQETDGCKFDISDWTFAGQIRDVYGAATASADFTMAIITPTSGSLQAQLPATRSLALVPGLKFYDIEMYSGSIELRILEGECLVNPQVTT